MMGDAGLVEDQLETKSPESVPYGTAKDRGTF